MTRRAITDRHHTLLTAVADAARHVIDEDRDNGPELRAATFHDALVRLADRAEDLDAYCPRCDDAGVIARVLGGEPTSPPPVTERPCECEASRVIAAKRADQQRRTGTR